jgi:orotate phosphoribosyltransferase
VNPDLLNLFRETRALLDGHFVLRSGLHSRQFFQCALLLQHTSIAEKVCAMLAEKLHSIPATRVISPALGGLIVGHEVARSLSLPHIFAEKDDAGRLVLRRGFEIAPEDQFIIVEDVVTRGGRVQETLEIVRSRGAQVAAVACLVDRSGGQHPDFGAPFISLTQLNVETFAPDQIPPDLAAIPASKPGSK